MLATGSEDGRVVVHRVSDGQATAEAMLDGGLGAMAMSPDGRGLLCVTRSKRIALLDLSGEVLRTAELPGQQVPTMIAVHPSGSSVVVADNASPSRLTVVDLPLLDGVRTVQLPQDVRDICFINGGKSLALGHRGIEVLSYPDLEHERFEFVDRTAWHRARPVSGGRYVSVSTARHARLFDTDQASFVHHVSRPNAFPSRVRFSPDGSLLAVHGGATVLLLDGHDLSLLAELEGTRDHSRMWSSVAFSPDGGTLAFSAGRGEVALTDLRTGSTSTFAAHAERVYTIAFSPDGSLLATACGRGELKLWKLGGEPALVTEKKVDQFASAVEFSASGGSLLVLQAFGAMIECAVPTLEVVHRVERAGGFAADVSPDGASVAISRWKGAAEIVAWPDGGEPRAIGEGAARTGGVRFSGRGELLATAGFDGAVRLWDAKSGICLFTRDGEASSLADVAFAPDDSRLAWVGESTGVFLMDLTAMEPRLARHAAVFVAELEDGWSSARGAVVKGWGVGAARPSGDGETTARGVRAWGGGVVR
jgi:WD40 repeat protein